MTTFAELTTLRVGGSIADLAVATDDAEIIRLVADADRRGIECLVLGGGSNLLCGDAAFPGRVVQVASRGFDVDVSGRQVLVEAAAGEPWDELVEFAVAQGWSGIEALSGIPGRVGATPIQNVGAYGQEIGEVISHVTAYDRRAGEVTTLSPAELGLAYRSSRLKTDPDRFVVLRVALSLRTSGGSPLRYAELAEALDVGLGETVDDPASIRAAVLDLRRAKGMVLDDANHDTWSAGSFFTNPVVSDATAAALPDCRRWPAPGGVKLSAAWLIEQAGVGKGYRLHPGSPAAVSGRHSLALTNRGGARAADITDLATAITARVESEFAITLEPEPRCVNL